MTDVSKLARDPFTTRARLGRSIWGCRFAVAGHHPSVSRARRARSHHGSWAVGDGRGQDVRTGMVAVRCDKFVASWTSMEGTAETRFGR